MTEDLSRYISKFTNRDSNEKFLGTIKENYNQGNLSTEEVKFLFTLVHNSESNIITEEKVYKSNSLILSVVNESGRNQGENETSYFKVYRYPSNGSDLDECLRISFFGPIYELSHKHTSKKLLDKDEKELLINILLSDYIPNSKKQQELAQYKIMVDLYNQQKENFYKDPRNKYTKIIYPAKPTIWIALVHYFNFVNSYKMNVSLLLPMPNYSDLPTN